MSAWHWRFDYQAENDFASLDKPVRRRIIDKLDWLVANFKVVKQEVLTGDFRDYFKLRVGKWRLFYKVDWANKTIIVVDIDPRDKAYK